MSPAYRYLVRWKVSVGVGAWNDGSRWTSFESALEEARSLTRAGYCACVVDTATGCVS